MGKYQVEIVNCFSLHVRTGASTSTRVVQWVQRGQKFTSSKQSNGWYYLDEKKGYSKGTYIKVIKNLDVKPPAKPAPKPKPKPKPTKPAPPKPNYGAIAKAMGKKDESVNKFPQLNKDTRVPKMGESDFSLNEWAAEDLENVFHGADSDFTGPIAPPNSNSNEVHLAKASSIPGIQSASNKKLSLDSNGELRMSMEVPSDGYGSGNNGPYAPETPDIPTPPVITDFNVDLEFIKDNMKIIRENYGITGETSNIRSELMTRFNRFKIPQPDYHLSKTFSHVFFTRPNLNLLMDEGTRLHDQFVGDGTFDYLWNNNPTLVQSLTQYLSKTHDFHPQLSNAAGSFELSDEFIKTIEHGATFTGYKIQYGRHNIDSNTAGQFTVQYQDDASFNIYKTHKAWIEYISRVYRGVSRPTKNNMKAKILDYASSVYYFVCGADGETILYWTKYFGVFPLNTPASAGSWARGGGIRLPDFGINYAYAMKEDFNPLSLAEFNMNSSEDFTYRKIYEPELVSTGRTMSGAPFIESAKEPGGAAVYKLKFRM